MGDGFKFGCGMLLAAAFALAVVLLLVTLSAFVASLLGIPPPTLGAAAGTGLGVGP